MAGARQRITEGLCYRGPVMTARSSRRIPPDWREERDRRWRYERGKVSVPEGVAGEWSVRRFAVTSEYAGQYNQYYRAQWGRAARVIEQGVYTGLFGPGGDPWMSDVFGEQADHEPAIRRIEQLQPGGQVLMNGLGLGMVLQAVLRRGRGFAGGGGMARVDVIEVQSEVIQLVGPHYQRMAERAEVELTIIEADALRYRFPAGRRWDVVWHDIWPEVSTDNLATMTRLHRRYGTRARWQDSWCRREVLWLRRREQREQLNPESFLAPSG